MAVKTKIRAEDKFAGLETINRGMAGGEGYENLADLLLEVINAP
jgi:hypothetical protein